MSFELAKKIIRKEFEFVQNSSDYDEIEFELFGGEPFVKFDLMKQIMEWTWSQKWKIPYYFFATTNGTLITEDVKQWLVEHNEAFVAGISYDGAEDSQDSNRSNSATKVDLDFFLKTYPRQKIKMTISPESVKNLAEDVLYLTEKGARISANCGSGQVWSEENKNEFRKQLMILADYYLENPEIEPVSIFERKIRNVVAKLEDKWKWCGSGTMMTAYDVDGKNYPCQLFTPLVLGNNNAADLHKRMDFSDRKINGDPICVECSLFNICPTCLGFNYRDTGNIATREKTMCELFRIQTSVLAYYTQELLRKKKEAGIPFDNEDRLDAKGLLFLKDNPPKEK